MSSPAPAPTESSMTSCFPVDVRSGLTGWTMSRRWPFRLASLIVETTRPTTRPRNTASPNGSFQAHRVHDAHNAGIHRLVFASIGHTSRAAGDHQDRFFEPGADGIDSDQIAWLFLAIGRDGFHDQQLEPFQARIFAGSNHSAHDAG